MNALKCRTLGVRACMNAGEVETGSCWLMLEALYIALVGAVRMLVLPHAVTAGASLYIEQEYLIAGKLE